MALSLRVGLLSCAVALTFVAAACGTEGNSASDSVPSDDVPGEAGAPLDFTVATADGGQLDFGTLEGRDVVLWFWAPW